MKNFKVGIEHIIKNPNSNHNFKNKKHTLTYSLFLLLEEGKKLNNSEINLLTKLAKKFNSTKIKS